MAPDEVLGKRTAESPSPVGKAERITISCAPIDPLSGLLNAMFPPKPAARDIDSETQPRLWGYAKLCFGLMVPSLRDSGPGFQRLSQDFVPGYFRLIPFGDVLPGSRHTSCRDDTAGRLLAAHGRATASGPWKSQITNPQISNGSGAPATRPIQPASYSVQRLRLPAAVFSFSSVPKWAIRVPYFPKGCNPCGFRTAIPRDFPARAPVRTESRR